MPTLASHTAAIKLLHSLDSCYAIVEPTNINSWPAAYKVIIVNKLTANITLYLNVTQAIKLLNAGHDRVMFNNVTFPNRFRLLSKTTKIKPWKAQLCL